MRFLLFFLLIFPFFCSAQNINQIDSKGMKQGLWKKTYDNGNIRYKGNFIDDKAEGIQTVGDAIDYITENAK